MAAELELAGVALSTSMRWVEQNQPLDVVQNTRATLGGGVVVHAGDVVAGQPITLQSSDEAGLLLYPVVQELTALANEPGATYVLTINGVDYNVMFRNDDKPSFEADPLVPRLEPMEDDYFRCTIKLMRV